jgi:hypothetical protein
MLAQQNGSKLKACVRNEPVVGKQAFFDQIGATAARRRTSRHSDTPRMDTPHARRRVAVEDFDWADLIDAEDKVRTLIDPTSTYAMSAAKAPGHTLDVNNQFEKGLNEALAGAPNDIARQMIVRQMPRVHGEVHRAALAAEATANIAKRNAHAMETLDIFARLVQADPSQLARKFEEAAALGRSILMSLLERKAFEAKRQELPRIALSSLIDRNPEGALLEMKQGRWSQYVDSDTLKRMRSIAEHQITLGQHNVEAESEFNKEHLRLDLDKFGKTLVDGQITTAADALNSPERFTEVLGKNVAKTAGDTVAAQREIGTFFSTAQSATEAERQQYEQEIGSRLGFTEAVEPAKLREQLLAQHAPEDLRKLANDTELFSPALVQASSIRRTPGSPVLAKAANWNWDPEPTKEQANGWEDVTPVEQPLPGADGPEIWRTKDLDTPFPPYPVVPHPVNGVQPDRWRRHPDPHTPGGHILISPDELPERQQKNLREREWVSPTQQVPDYGPTGLGDSYFGSYRAPGRGPQDWYFHGGLDFKGSKVVLPTRARFKELRYSRVYGYMISFDLGDGMTLSLLHVQPTAELLALAKSGDHPIWDARHELGVVDPTVYKGKGDHVHVQITMENGRYNGQPAGFAIDPTPMFPNQYSPPQRAPASNGWQQFWDWLKTLGR